MQIDSNRTWDNQKKCWEYRNANGEFHRDGNKPAQVCMENNNITQKGGFTAWYRNGKYHRDDGGPAIDDGLCRQWYQNGKRHRKNGPAWICNDGLFRIWYKDGNKIKQDGFGSRCHNSALSVNGECTNVFSTHNKPFTFKQFIDREVSELDNYSIDQIREWTYTYGLKNTDKVIWVSPDKFEANRYNYDTEEQEKFDNLSDIPLGNLFEYGSEDGFIIHESDDGDNGFLLVFREPE